MTFILDASAALAMIFDEAGGDVVLASSRGGYISAVNMDEVLHKCARRGIAIEKMEALLARLDITIVPFDLTQARASAQLHPDLHRRDKSIADRACFALAQVTGRTILSADGDWAKIELPVDIRLIR